MTYDNGNDDDDDDDDNDDNDKVINVACPFDTRIAEKEREKIDHQQDLKVEIQKMWNWKSVSVVPVVFGVLGAGTKNLMMWVTKIVTLTSESLLVGNSKDLKKDPRHSRL